MNRSRFEPGISLLNQFLYFLVNQIEKARIVPRRFEGAFCQKGLPEIVAPRESGVLDSLTKKGLFDLEWLPEDQAVLFGS